jgi:hypothetical protein
MGNYEKRDEAVAAIEEAILEMVNLGVAITKSDAILNLAEARAWLVSPNNAHGGGADRGAAND